MGRVATPPVAATSASMAAARLPPARRPAPPQTSDTIAATAPIVKPIPLGLVIHSSLKPLEAPEIQQTAGEDRRDGAISK